MARDCRLYRSGSGDRTWCGGDLQPAGRGSAAQSSDPGPAQADATRREMRVDRLYPISIRYPIPGDPLAD